MLWSVHKCQPRKSGPCLHKQGMCVQDKEAYFYNYNHSLNGYKMSSELRCLTWEGDWSDDIVTEAAEKGRRGVYGKIVLTMCGEVG